ncbi:septum formation family protein [Actinophytocola xanthii]|uniref:septum formation family protein n=1 Tax=Actinophytocola xanthii TaxID=1912961 RepID=UPI001300F3EF|nr:septum formation family protein [Actinophytocola xanthii]
MRTRLVMAGAFIGALAVLSGSMLFSWPVSVKEGTADTAVEEAAEAFDSPPGTCLDWPHDKPQNMRRVPCDKPHTFEVTSNVEIKGEYGPNSPPPATQEWQQIVTDKCTAEAAKYLGGALDPFGKYTPGALKPSAEQWREGDRQLRCGLQRVTPSADRLMQTKGAAAEQDQSNVYEPGTCFALVEGEVGDPVDCDRAHAYEVVGVVDLSKTFDPKTYPAEADQREKLVDLCPPVANKYTGNANLAATQLSLYSDTLKKESWDAGSHLVNCKVGARQPDGALRPVRGSVAAEKAPSSTPSTPSTAPSSTGR